MEARLLEILLFGDVSSLHALLAEDPLNLNRAELDPTSETPLHIAALAGKTELVKEIIAIKPDFIRRLNPDGFTPLHIASAVGNLDIVKELLSVSPDLCMQKDKGGRTPLHYAAIKGRVEIIEELFSHSPQALEERTARRETALHLAVVNSQFVAVKLLVEKAGDGDPRELIKAEDDDGNRVLHLAMASDQLRILDFLKSRNMIDKGIVDVLDGETCASTKASQNSSNSICGKWSEVKPVLPVVASVIAQATFQASPSPQQTLLNAVLFCVFMLFNTIGFVASVFLMFDRKPFSVKLLLAVALFSTGCSYLTLGIANSSNYASWVMIYVLSLFILLIFMTAIIVHKKKCRLLMNCSETEVAEVIVKKPRVILGQCL